VLIVLHIALQIGVESIEGTVHFFAFLANFTRTPGKTLTVLEANFPEGIASRAQGLEVLLESLVDGLPEAGDFPRDGKKRVLLTGGQTGGFYFEEDFDVGERGESILNLRLKPEHRGGAFLAVLKKSHEFIVPRAEPIEVQERLVKEIEGFLEERHPVLASAGEIGKFVATLDEPIHLPREWFEMLSEGEKHGFHFPIAAGEEIAHPNKMKRILISLPLENRTPRLQGLEDFSGVCGGALEDVLQHRGRLARL
jgi:hypothetical protein